MIVRGAAVGLSPFDVRVTLHPLMALSCSMESMGLEADFYVAELPFFVRISNKRTAWEES